MAAAHIANVTIKQDETLVHLPSGIPLQPGPVVYELRPGGEILLKPHPADSAEAKRQAWVAFLDFLDQSPSDPAFMPDRPLNRLPVDRNLFPDD